MRGSAFEERRSEKLQSLMVLGLLADDVALATLHYPNLTNREADAVRSLGQLLKDVEQSNPDDRRAFPPRKSMTNPAALLSHAVALVDEGVAGEKVAVPNLGALREPLRMLLVGEADEAATMAVREFCQVLGHATLVMAEGVVHERGSEEWTERASLFSAA